MFIAVDVGNTQTTLGLFDAQGIIRIVWRMVTDTHETSDMLHARIISYCIKDGIDPQDITQGALASVAPSVDRAWKRCLSALCRDGMVVVDTRLTLPLTLDIDHPEQLGADRIANAIAALATYTPPVIVVDFGTATNIDVLDSDGVYRGGCISPGLMLSAEALFGRAAKLSSIPIVAPQHCLGTSTEKALQSGLVIGAAASAEGLVARIKQELDCPQALVVATGGLSHTVAEATDLFDEIDPTLTLRGIYEIWKTLRSIP